MAHLETVSAREGWNRHYLLALALAVAALPRLADAQTQTYVLMKTAPPIAGTSQISGHVGEIELESVAVSGATSCTIEDPNPTCSSASFQPVEISKRLDQADPLFFQRLATQTQITGACVYVLADLGGGGLQLVQQITLGGAYVTGITPSVSAAGTLAQTIRLDYTQLAVTVTPVDGNGDPQTPVQFCWDRNTSTGCTTPPSC